MTRIAVLTDRMKKAVKTEMNLIRIKDLNESVLPSPDLSRAAKAAIFYRKVGYVDPSKRKNSYHDEKRNDQLEDQPNENYTGSAGNYVLEIRTEKGYQKKVLT